MRLPLRVEYIPDTNRTTGEPAWKVIEADGWPVCLCWSEDYAKRIAAAFAAADEVATNLPANRAWTDGEKAAHEAIP